MSIVSPLSPRPDQLAFLPHSPRSPRTPPTSFGSLTTGHMNGTSRRRSQTLSSLGGYASSSKSAPSSPLGRSSLPKGMTIAPLSIIAPLHLDSNQGLSRPNGSQGYQRVASNPLPSRLASQPRHPAPSPSNPSTSKPRPPPSPNHHVQSLQSSPRAGSSSRTTSRSYLRRPSDSSSGTETEVDSDTTLMPGGKSRHKQSLSQPDLGALRSRLEGWAGGVAKGQVEERKAREARRRTPPLRPTPLSSQSATTGFAPYNVGSKSQPSLTALRKSPSPRSSPSPIPHMTPVSSASSESSSPRLFARTRLGPGMARSEDGDDDYDGATTDSPSSSSLTFSPKRSRGLRQRMAMDKSKGLGLSFQPETSPVSLRKEDPTPVYIERRLQKSSLLSLRLLAVVPSLWGICVLVEAFISGGLWVDVWPWRIDLSREALERLVAGGMGEPGTWKSVNRGDMLLSIAWALCTAHFCFHLTTGLTHRWRSYYSLPSTLTRLLSLQCLCWPATYLTLWFLGARRPLLAWIVIGVTTGWSRTVQMWVTSNVIPGEVTPRAKSHKPLEGLSWWEHFTWGRRWDWDAIAANVGWKVGALLLVTTAWLFWGIETGRLIEA